MVGVPTSKGCALCLTRAIKCDEARPGCSQCRRGQRVCPGYAREMKFVDEGPRLPRRARILAPSVPAPAPIPAHAVAMNAKQDCHQAVAVFVSDMFPLHLTASAQGQSTFLGSWLWHVPSHLGRHAFLDAAALSLALAYSARLSRDQTALCRAKTSYGAALGSLARVVTDPKRRLSSQALCAVLLLGYFETFVDGGHTWIRHASGAAHLMRLRGARKCYDSAFDYAMFLSCRGALIAEALASQEPCFLDADEWQSIPDGLIDFPLLPPSPDLYHEIFGCFAAIPGLLKQAKTLGTGLAENERQSILLRAATLRDRITGWRRRYISGGTGPAIQVLVNPPAVRDNYPFYSVYTYRDVASATMVTASYAYAIALNRGCIDVLQPDSDSTEANAEMALEICMSVDYCSRAGYCGASTMKFALPIAQSALPDRYHGWIVAWLARFSSVLDPLRVR